jgi:hypothetical protein
VLKPTLVGGVVPLVEDADRIKIASNPLVAQKARLRKLVKLTRARHGSVLLFFGRQNSSTAP